MEFRSLEAQERYQLDDILQMVNRIFWMEWTKYNEPMMYWLPALFSILLLFISPILLDDLKHRSVLAVKPIRQWKYLLQKMSSYWLVNMALVLLVLFGVFLVQSLSFGVGNINFAISCISWRRGGPHASITIYRDCPTLCSVCAPILNQSRRMV